jgi:phospholipid N-methyltransferase
MTSLAPDCADGFAFLRDLLRDPRRVSAIAPSGRDLAALITSRIDAADAPVIELGAGTGVFTRQLIKRGVPEDKLVLIEFGSESAAKLQWKFPSATVFWMDASTLQHFELLQGRKAGAVVSGLPLLSMPPKKVIRILRGAFQHLREDGSLYQFTYGARCPVPDIVLKRCGLKAERPGRVLLNLPPATVYRLSRRT